MNELATPTRSATTDRGRATRTRILNCALRLMWRYGYTEVGVNRLIEEAGVRKGSFYHFFPSKLDLLIAMFEHVWQVQKRKIIAIHNGPGTPSEKLRAHIGWVCEAQVKTFEEEGFVPGLLHMVAGITLLEENPLLAEKVRSLAVEHGALMISIMEQITTQGRAAAEHHATVLGHFLGGAFFHARLMNSLGPVREVEAFTEAIIVYLQAGGGPRPIAWLTSRAEGVQFPIGP